MSQPTDVVRQYFEAAPKRDFDKIRQLLHKEFSYTGGDGQRQEGADAAIAVVDTYTTACPDLQLDVQHQYAAGNIVVTEFIARGTHRGKLMDLEATGRTVALPVCNVIEVRDDKVYAEREYFDSAEMMKQLGVGE
jgi:steroid delta-isomerase-like uncharacterized protein